MSKERGFSLVEVLVGLLILTIVITTTIVMFTERHRRLRQANDMILAYQALSNEVEIWRRIDFAQLDGLQYRFNRHRPHHAAAHDQSVSGRFELRDIHELRAIRRVQLHSARSPIYQITVKADLRSTFQSMSIFIAVARPPSVTVPPVCMKQPLR